MQRRVLPAYADWTKEVMVNLLQSLLYTYQEKSEDFLHPVANQQIFSAQHATAIFSSAAAPPVFRPVLSSPRKSFV